MKISSLSLIVVLLFISCQQPQPRKPVINKSSSFMEESVSFNKSLIETEEAFFQKRIQQDSLRTYNTSSNGFWYTIDIKSENNYFPKKGDQVLYSYEVFDVYKNIIYSEEEVGAQSYYVDEENLIEGLRNGIKLMNEGDVVTFLFPSHKVFGYLGDENKIGINQSLIYKVKLNKIKKKNEERN